MIAQGKNVEYLRNEAVWVTSSVAAFMFRAQCRGVGDLFRCATLSVAINSGEAK